MDFSDVLHSRRSIRAFADKPVPQAIIDSILTDAIESPSSSNTQPYKVAVATGKTCQQLGQELLEKYRKINVIQRQPLPLKLFNAATSNAMPDGDYKPILGKYPGIFQDRRMHTGKGLYEIMGIQRGDKKARDAAMARNFTFFDAPVAIFVFIHPGMKFTALVDAGIMMQSLMLSATDKGLGTCPQGALGMWRSPLEKHFDIPKGYNLVCGLALGYPKEDEEVNSYRPRKISLDELLIPTK
ncbi:nitroreductase [Alteromonas sp. ASW11-36]|uniref:Nitroreductase n=1 Tax=Alteromonas arenosi TaxID=3055817 RepID=A0ABT7SU28_9ALTE|nr:nitroreductase [Alteromonas sp. ASW11-36]MDM7859019.1 nitroreductase [Alteromonas sp. ASW11-36]